MNGLQTEDRILGVNTSLSADIAKRLANHLPVGKVVVVSRQPAALLASTRKQWLKLLRLAQRQRSSTLDAVKIHELTQKIAMMQRVRFAAGSLLEEIEANVLFATAEQLLTFPPACPTMYVATPTEREMVYRITGFMPKGGVVVEYKINRPKDYSS